MMATLGGYDRQTGALDGSGNIQIGSIIHLENGAPQGGFLDVRGWVTDKPVITLFQDPRIRAFVFTHESPQRAEGSGSWRIVSAAGKPEGEPLRVGDKVHLLSLLPGAGYLDTFEWVSRLPPFKNYPMTIGVFTCSEPRRGGGPSGTWTVGSAGDKRTGAPIVQGDAIFLENDYPGAGFLYTFGDVTGHDLFKDYTGQRKFVFTDPNTEQPSGSRLWTVRLSGGMNHWYRVQVQWGEEDAPWHEEGLFGLGHRAAHPVTALRLTSTDSGETLAGTVTYLGETPIPLRASHKGQNRYDIDPGDQTSTQPVWRIGARELQRVVSLDVESDDDGVTLRGEITYAGEGPVRLHGARAEDVGASGFGLAAPDPVLGRTRRLEGVIEATHRLLTDAILEIRGVSLAEASTIVAVKERLLAQIEERNAAPNTGTTGQAQGDSTRYLDLDRDFQIRQLLNLHALSQRLNAFMREQLQPIIRQSLHDHQQQQTPAPLHLMRRGLQRVATDHEIIQQATLQRRWNRRADGNYYVSEQALELLVMDKLAIKALAPFRHLLPQQADRDHPAIVSYLSERTHMHHTPYAGDLLLIGVSYDRVPPAESLFADRPLLGANFPAAELMAIPHEVGHYMYHHARLDKAGTTFEDLSAQFLDNPYQRWCEELFSDLYGCVVAGPLAALSMQALLTSGDRARAWRDDEAHPTPMLRVFLLAEMLRVLAKRQEERAKLQQNVTEVYAFPKVVDQLDQDWAKILKAWGYERVDSGDGRPARVYLPDPAAVQLDKLVNVKRVLAAVRPIIVTFAEKLLSLAEFAPRQPQDGDSLSLAIPWCRRDSSVPEEYHQEMVAIRQDARKKAPRQPMIGNQLQEMAFSETHPDRRLQEVLAAWEDRGPTGFGDNPG